MKGYCNFKTGSNGYIVDSNSTMKHQDWNIEREVFQLQGKNLPLSKMFFFSITIPKLSRERGVHIFRLFLHD